MGSPESIESTSRIWQVATRHCWTRVCRLVRLSSEGDLSGQWRRRGGARAPGLQLVSCRLSASSRAARDSR